MIYLQNCIYLSLKLFDVRTMINYFYDTNESTLQMFLETSFNVSSRIDKLMSIELTTCQFAIDICEGYQKLGSWVFFIMTQCAVLVFYI